MIKTGGSKVYYGWIFACNVFSTFYKKDNQFTWWEAPVSQCTVETYSTESSNNSMQCIEWSDMEPFLSRESKTVANRLNKRECFTQAHYLAIHNLAFSTIFSCTLSDKITDVVRPLICLKFNIQATFVKSMFLSFNGIKNETFIHSVSVINFRPSIDEDSF